MADRYDLVIVGMGSAGLVAAEFAANLDLKVAVVERDRVGGDCLWTGCVPSEMSPGATCSATQPDMRASAPCATCFSPGKGNVDDFIPWCTFTDPELAHAGLTMAAAEAQFGDDIDIWQIGLDHNDRARADSVTAGAIIVITAKGRIVGAHILAPNAGELIHELALAIRKEMKLDEVAQLVHIYPTLATSIGQLAAESAFERAHRLRWLVKRR